jgi:hypothetical protein
MRQSHGRDRTFVGLRCRSRSCPTRTMRKLIRQAKAGLTNRHDRRRVTDRPLAETSTAGVRSKRTPAPVFTVRSTAKLNCRARSFRFAFPLVVVAP